MGLLCGAFLISVVLKGSSSWEQLQTVRLPRPPPGPTSLVVATGANAVSARLTKRRSLHGYPPPGLLTPCFTTLPFQSATTTFLLTACFNSRRQAYFRGLANLVGSVKFWCPECNLVVYNLGLDKQQLGNVTTWCGIDVRNGSSFTRLGNVRKVCATTLTCLGRLPKDQ